MIKDVAEKISLCSTICVTGQMAAGKNYICSQLEELGWHATDLDLTAHKAISECNEEIIAAFKGEAERSGLSIVDSKGEIDRRALGRLLFKNPPLLAKQESIIYPKIIELTNAFIKENQKTIINATVLYKTPELLNLCDAVVFVTAPFITRLFRARRRDHLPYRQILRRFRAQKHLLKEYKKTGKPVFIVRNN